MYGVWAGNPLMCGAYSQANPVCVKGSCPYGGRLLLSDLSHPMILVLLLKCAPPFSATPALPRVPLLNPSA